MTVFGTSVGRAFAKVVELVADPALNGVMAGRKRGEEERLRLEKELRSVDDGAVLGIDVGQVLFVNHSFVDECFGALVRKLFSGEYKDRFVVLVASPEEQAEMLEDVSISLERRKLAMLCSGQDGEKDSTYIIGELPEYLRSTLNAVEPGDTNESLAEKLNIKLTTCSNRTDRLAKLRLLRKQLRSGELGYKQFEFSPVLPPA